MTRRTPVRRDASPRGSLSNARIVAAFVASLFALVLCSGIWWIARSELAPWWVMNIVGIGVGVAILAPPRRRS